MDRSCIECHVTILEKHPFFRARELLANVHFFALKTGVTLIGASLKLENKLNENFPE